MYFALIYEVVPDHEQRRGPFRGEHLDMLRGAHERGELVMAGAYAEPMDGALLLWRGEDQSAVESFVAADPYVRAGLVTSWQIRNWTVVVGP